MLCGVDKPTHFRCLGGLVGGRFPIPAACPTPTLPRRQFFGALSVFSEHEVEGILTLYCSLTWGEGGQIWRARVGGDWGGDSFWGEKRQTTFLQP